MATAFYPPVVPHSTRFIRPVTRPLSNPSQRTNFIRGLLTRLCADPRTVFFRGKVRPVNTVPREAWFWLSFDGVVRYQLHFPLPAAVSSTVELYIEIAHLWPKIKTWNLESATIDGLDTDITAILSEFAEATAFERTAQQAALAALPKTKWTGMDGALLWEQLNRQTERELELEELLGIY